MKITVRKPTNEELEDLEVETWGIWTKEESEFPWEYDEKETCFLYEGNVEVTTSEGEKVQFGAGDLVIFPKGLHCNWKVNKAVRKRYKFGD